MANIYIGSDTLNDKIDRSAFGTSDLLSGLGGNDTLIGGAGNDTLDGGLGDDSLVGGDGNDTYYVDYAYDFDTDITHVDQVVETASATPGTDTVITSSSGYTLAKNVENLVLLQGGAAYGNSLGNIITGSDTIDYLYGRSGNDTILGGKGNDIIYGDDGDDSLEGGDGNDDIKGGLGTDTLVGGNGDDTYYVTSYWDDNDVLHRDTVIESNQAGSGTDTVLTYDTNYTLANNVENLTLLAGALAHGNALGNRITGTADDDFLDGVGGNDTILSGAGNDIIWAGEGDDSVDGGDGNDWILGDARYGSTNQTLTGNDILQGGNGNDHIDGGNGNDTLYGGEGNDTLIAGAGDNTLYGGNGDDTYYVHATYYDDFATTPHMDLVKEIGTTGIDTMILIDEGLIYMPPNVENATLQTNGWCEGNKLDNLIVGPAANVPSGNGWALLEGKEGNDTILAGRGADQIFGGQGNDSLDGGEGDDLIHGDANMDSQLPTRWIGNDILRGGGGNDSLMGELGNDALFGGTGNDTLDGGEDDDSLSGDEGNDVLTDTSASSNDVYAWGRGMGADVATDSGGTDRLDVLSGVTTSQLWLRHIGNNLEVSVIGTGDSFTVSNWYASAANQIESIKLSDGKTLAANKVDNLVNAMASFTPPAAGQTTLPANYQAALNPVIAANWA
jgi:Ca2+-binding RTX toxin-like protein